MIFFFIESDFAYIVERSSPFLRPYSQLEYFPFLKNNLKKKKIIILLICLFLVVLGLCCCAGISLVVMSKDCCLLWFLLIAVAFLLVECRFQDMWASVVAACGLRSCGSWAPKYRLNSCGTQAQFLRDTWDLPEPGIELMSLTLAGGFFTEPPGKPHFLFSFYFMVLVFIFLLSYFDTGY